MLTKIPGFIRSLFPNRLWKIATEENVLYLTFDDGPIPEVTPWVLNLLREYEAKATFFCIADNIRKNPEIFNQIVTQGHSVGNHAHNHLNGWKTPVDYYVKNVLLADDFMSGDQEINSERSGEVKLFRPPYGRITGKQAKLLREKNFRIVMWDVLSRDYNRKLSPENCLKNVLRYTEPGSIIVFHDSLKAAKNLKKILPQVLEHFSRKGFKFEKL